MEEIVSIATDDITLEGRFCAGGAVGAALITHPHPLFGGSMDNNVVWTAHRACEARGWASLRVNFRGVGRSTGSYGNGVQEAEDVAAALTFLKGRATGPYYIIGYSFGAAVAARAMLGGLEGDGLWLIAPPLAFMEMTFLPLTPRLQLIVVGDADDLCPLPSLRSLLEPVHQSLNIITISGASHFFHGSEEKLFKVLKDFNP